MAENGVNIVVTANVEEATSALRKVNDSFKDIDKSMKDSANKFKDFGKKLKDVGKGVSDFGKDMSAKVSAPIIAAGVASFNLASDLNETYNKLDTVFSKSSDSIKKWGNNTLEQFGIAKGSALDMVALYGDMASSMGLPEKASADMAKSLTGLAGDLASFKNIKLDVAKTALNGIFTGETESLKSLGVVMTVANLEAYAMAEGITKSYDEMTEAEKVQLRYQYVLDKTKNAQGDFSKTSDSASNQTRIFWESLKELGAMFG